MCPGWQNIDIDPQETLKTRRRMRLHLARYGRVDYFAWENEEVPELRAAYDCLVELLEAESGSSTLTEELR